MSHNYSSFCGGPDHIWRPNRREFIFVGLVGSVGLTLGNLFKLQAQTSGPKARAQSVINIFLPGGIAAQESFDPKLLAPIEYRGPLSSVKTSIEGVHFCEHLKTTGRSADKTCVICSRTNGVGDHGRGVHSMFAAWSARPA